MAVLPRVETFSRPLFAAISSSVLSAAIYFWLAPLLAPSLRGISRPVDSFPWWAPAAGKLIESTLLATTTLANSWDAALVGTIGRAPFLHLLFSSFSVPWHAIVSLYIVDIASLVVPQHFFANSVPPHTPYDDRKLASYTSLLSATFISLPLYYLSAKFLPMTLVTYFDAATSVVPLPLPIVIALNIPVGYALQTLLARYGVKGAIAALSNVFVTGCGTIYYGIAGAEIQGVQVVDTIWLVSIAVGIAATYGFVIRK